MIEISLRNYAHLGDAVWELYVREHTIFKTSNSKELHRITTEKVKAGYQSELLKLLESYLNDEEQDIIRRARNLTVPVSRRSIQYEYRQATAFEALLGWLYINNKERLTKILKKSEINFCN